MPVFRVRHRGASIVLLTLVLPRIGEHTSIVTVKTVHAAEGAFLRPNAKLFDLAVDLSAALAHDCPPVSRFRIALRDPAWVRRLAVSEGDTVAPGALLGLFSSEANEPLEDAPARALRVSIAGILDQSGWWGSGGP